MVVGFPGSDGTAILFISSDDLAEDSEGKEEKGM